MRTDPTAFARQVSQASAYHLRELLAPQRYTLFVCFLHHIYRDTLKRVAAVLAITREGHSARMIAKYRPGVPIIAATRSRRVACQLLLSYGGQPDVARF